jgi:sigma-B regulation protein RsbU (phosphoserine phosphatase)
MFADATFGVGTLALDAGESLVAFTDGVSETADPAGREFGREGVLAACREVGDGDAGSIRSAILAAVGDFRGKARVGDDVTLAVVRRPRGER